MISKKYDINYMKQQLKVTNWLRKNLLFLRSPPKENIKRIANITFVKND
ncbi:MAG: hypothetical protein ACOC56_05230 [Atribacterota bacterium]